MRAVRSAAVLACFLASSRGLAAEPVPESYAWPDLDHLVTGAAALTGESPRIYKLVLDSDGKADLWIQDPKRRDFVDSYEYEHARIEGPVPIKFTHYPSIEALDRHVIEAAAVDFRRLPGMLATARARTSLPDARVVRIELERGDSHGFLVRSDIPIWTFDIATPRHDARVEFDLDGRVLDVDKD